MKRREFITLLGGAAAWPHATGAQLPAKLPTVGFLGGSTKEAARQWVVAFVQGLRERSWIDGETVVVKFKYGEGRNERLAEIAAEFVRLQATVILTHATAPTVAAKQATSVIPIVFATAADPVGNGLVAALARPGGNGQRNRPVKSGRRYSRLAP
jgi:putative ABC transport system substrate-binding protein